ncbi:glycosyl hydrolase family 18 protein [Paenibacillus camelliae]|uniref:glycosyl hydrolase family 18 protein n=1 Tax=Paenibacillus camelliae TaxID=512410 RepID=UPI00203BE450|nr:glycosyl hydrolase family 18 protein [Paenibacillus camelliae]MCM3634903.1 glycosyl hydrolase family 18 protein [Paenibacillus camelliae]
MNLVNRSKKWSTRMMLMSVLLLIVSAFGPTSFAATATSQQDNSYKIVGYFPSWGAYGRNFNVADIDASKLTHINYAFADICWNGTHGNPDPTGPNPQTWPCQNEAGQTINVPNGTIVLGDPWIDAQKSFPGDTWDQPIRGNLNELIKLKQQHPHLKTIISVGGWSWSNRFSDVAASDATRKAFAQSAVDFIRKYQMDGVDLDWEYPVSGGLPGNSYRPEDKQNHTLLLQEVRNYLDAAEIEDDKTYTLTIASSASPSYAENNELDEIAEIVDWINIMTYDFNGGWSNQSAHNAPLYLDSAAIAANVENAATFNADSGVQGHLNAGVPAEKIVLGLPFYGRGWAGCAPGANGDGQYQPCTGTPAGTWESGVFDYGDLVANYVNKNGFVRYWNDEAKVPYLYNASSKTFISYDDSESFTHKVNYIKSRGLGGGMFWELSSDCHVSPQYSCSGTKLLDVLAEQLNNGEGPDPGGPGTGDPDTTPPTAPTGLTVTGKTATSISLSWTASTDNNGVTGYQVFRDGTLVSSLAGTSTTINNLTSNTTYVFTVKARDAAGNLSDASAPLSVTTDEAATPACPVAEWNASQIYTSGNQVVYNGIIYEAQWWTQGERPDLSGEWDVWRVIGSC